MHLSVLGRVDTTSPPLKLPLAAGEVRAGFTSPADDYLETGLLAEPVDDGKRVKNEKLMATLDKLNREHGKNIRYGWVWCVRPTHGNCVASTEHRGIQRSGRS